MTTECTADGEAIISGVYKQRSWIEGTVGQKLDEIELVDSDTEKVGQTPLIVLVFVFGSTVIAMIIYINYKRN